MRGYVNNRGRGCARGPSGVVCVRRPAPPLPGCPPHPGRFANRPYKVVGVESGGWSARVGASAMRGYVNDRARGCARGPSGVVCVRRPAPPLPGCPPHPGRFANRPYKLGRRRERGFGRRGWAHRRCAATSTTGAGAVPGAQAALCVCDARPRLSPAALPTPGGSRTAPTIGCWRRERGLVGEGGRIGDARLRQRPGPGLCQGPKRRCVCATPGPASPRQPSPPRAVREPPLQLGRRREWGLGGGGGRIGDARLRQQPGPGLCQGPKRRCVCATPGPASPRLPSPPRAVREPPLQLVVAVQSGAWGAGVGASAMRGCVNNRGRGCARGPSGVVCVRRPAPPLPGCPSPPRAVREPPLQVGAPSRVGLGGRGWAHRRCAATSTTGAGAVPGAQAALCVCDARPRLSPAALPTPGGSRTAPTSWGAVESGGWSAREGASAMRGYVNNRGRGCARGPSGVVCVRRPAPPLPGCPPHPGRFANRPYKLGRRRERGFGRRGAGASAMRGYVNNRGRGCARGPSGVVCVRRPAPPLPGCPPHPGRFANRPYNWGAVESGGWSAGRAHRRCAATSTTGAGAVPGAQAALCVCDARPRLSPVALPTPGGSRSAPTSWGAVESGGLVGEGRAHRRCAATSTTGPGAVPGAQAALCVCDARPRLSPAALPTPGGSRTAPTRLLASRAGVGRRGRAHRRCAATSTTGAGAVPRGPSSVVCVRRPAPPLPGCPPHPGRFANRPYNWLLPFRAGVWSAGVGASAMRGYVNNRATAVRAVKAAIVGKKNQSGVPPARKPPSTVRHWPLT